MTRGSLWGEEMKEISWVELGVDRGGNLRDEMEVARTGRVLRELTKKGAVSGLGISAS